MLEGKRAVITGASSGIGEATAISMAENGAAVALVGRDKSRLDAIASGIRDKGGTAATVVADLTANGQCSGVVEEAAQFLKGLDILVNSAGVIRTGTIRDTSLESWRQMININLDVVFQLMQASWPYLEESEGNIVNVSSVNGLRAFAGVLAYNVSKAAVDQLTRCSALELAPAGVRVNSVNPGVVLTNLHRRSGMDEDTYKAFLERGKTTHPLGRVGRAEEVAELIVFLASDKAKWITGASYSIDGGRHQTCAR